MLAVHKSKLGQDKAQRALAEHLQKHGQAVREIIVNNERPDVPHRIVEMLPASPAEKTVFFVSNIDGGGGQDGKEAYRALNIYRELFVENQIKAVFWLTTQEAANLPRVALDFWAFRHRVVEFTSLRGARRANLPVGVLIWDIQDSTEPLENDTAGTDARQARLRRLKDSIAEREEMLTRLPRNSNSLSARIEVLYNIGYLRWRLDDSDNASASFAAGLDLVAEHPLPRLKSHLLHGLAVLDYQAGNFDGAVEHYKKALQYSPEDNALLINLSAACSMLGRNHEAISISKRALRINAGDARVWNRLGYIYVAMGKSAESISCFAKAAELAPKVAAYHESLAIAYSILDRADESRREMGIARQLSTNQASAYLNVYEQAILGNTEGALESLRAAIMAKRFFPFELRRDPNLNLLFDVLPDEGQPS